MCAMVEQNEYRENEIAELSLPARWGRADQGLKERRGGRCEEGHHFKDGEGFIEKVILHDVTDGALHMLLHFGPIEHHLPLAPHHAAPEATTCGH